MSTALVSVHEWLNIDAELLEPETIQFTTKPAISCRGCLFQGQPSSVCNRAGKVASRAAIDDCEQGFVYVRVETDPRQLALIDGASK